MAEFMSPTFFATLFTAMVPLILAVAGGLLLMWKQQGIQNNEIKNIKEREAEREAKWDRRLEKKEKEVAIAHDEIKGLVTEVSSEIKSLRGEVREVSDRVVHIEAKS